MIHVWLNLKQNNYSVWNSGVSSWFQIDSLSNLEVLSFIKSNDKDICLYIPTQSVLTLENDLSVTQLKQLGKSGQQYLFEEVSLTSVEQLQTRYLSEGQDNYFYALADTEVEKWQNSIELVGYKLLALIPDFILLPSPESRLDHQVTLFQQAGIQQNVSQPSEPENTEYQRTETDKTHSNNISSSVSSQGTLLARFSESHGMAISHWTLLPRLLENVEEVIFITNSFSESEISIDQNLKTLFDEAGIVVTQSTPVLSPISAPNKHPLNFIEIKRNKLASPYLTLAAGLLLLAGITQISADVLQMYQYEKVSAKVTESTNEQFVSWFPDESLNTRVGVANQVKPRLVTNQGATQEQISLMSRLAPLLKQSQLVAQTLSWSDTNLSLVVKGQNRENIDKLQQNIKTQGWNSSLGSVAPSGDGSVIAEFNFPINESGALK